MLPILFSHDSFQLRSYDLCLCISIFICFLVAWNRARKMKYANSRLIILLSGITFFALLGARLNGWFFWFYGHEDMLNINISNLRSGMTAFGGLFGAMAFIVFFAYLHRWNILAILDLILPILALGESIQRIGCFLNGCCYGRHTNGILGLYLPDSIGEWSYRYPAQLIYGGFCAMLFFWLWRQRNSLPFHGYLALQYLIFYNTGRVILGFIRGDEPIVLGFLSTHQLTGAIVAIISCLWMFLILNRKNIPIRLTP